MSKLSLMDLAFFLTETKESPKHVGGLLTFKIPDNSSETFVTDLYNDCLKEKKATPPFNQVIKFSLTGMPEWRESRHFNIKDHLIFHPNKKQLSLEQLNAIVADLHCPILSKEKPLWEFHFLDNVEDDRFAVYFKMHHSYADGMTMSRWLTKMLSTDSSDTSISPLWSSLKRRKKSEREKDIRPGSTLVSLLKMMTGQSISYFQTARGLAKVSLQLGLERLNLTNNAISVPFSTASDTPLTGQVTEGRQIITARVPLDRVDKIRDKTRCTLNHIALTCIDTALHRYLENCGVDFNDQINISMPVSLREEGDTSTGNKIGIVLVDLSPKTDDMYVRLREIGFALRNIRYQVDDLPPSSIVGYTMLLMVCSQLAEILKLSNVVAPMGHTLVSNVPGPKETLYFKGAELEQMYPISTLPPGNRLNITLFSYDGYLHFGLIATKELLHLDNLGETIEAAFEELENSIS
jgi:diacylglycerol O-acyltransferase